MRRARITYPGAIHHVMNRGYDGKDIFSGSEYKNRFLEYLAETSKKLKIKVLAYCIMDNHYHLIIENSSGKMSEFLKRLNGMYGMYYRKVAGGQGYVFQGRFKSTLIDKDSYLIKSIVYLLQNPVRAGTIQKAEEYWWSSARAYLSKSVEEIVDAEWVIQLFGGVEVLFKSLSTDPIRELPVRVTGHGDVLGNDDFLKSALKKSDRRKRPSNQSNGSQRKDDRYFEPVEKVIKEFERSKGIRLDEIDTSCHKGKKHRGELLVLLKDQAGRTYKEIALIDIFCDLNFDSLRSVYRNNKKNK